MKKVLFAIGAVVATALGFSSCQKQEISLPESNMVTVTLTAEKAGVDTKTAAVEGDKAVSYEWTAEDMTNMKLFLVGEDKDGKETLTEIEREIKISEDNKTLSITAQVEKESTLRAALSSAWTSSNAPKVNINQSPAVDNFDPNADILVSDDVVVEGLDEELLTFRRPVAVSKMTLKNLAEGEKVYEISISSDNHLTGYYRDGGMTAQEKSITLSYENVAVDESGVFPVYFVTMPNEGHTLTVVVKTDMNTYTKSFGPLSFAVGKFAKFSVGLPKGTPVTITDYTGDWVITGENNGSVFAAQTYVSGNNNLKAIGVKLDISNEKISSTNVDGIKMSLEKVAEGDYIGLYTIKDASGKYLYAAGTSGSTNNTLKGGTELEGPDYYWSVEVESDGTFSIKAKESSNNKVMQFNSSSSIFSCYASANQKPVTLYPYSWVEEDTSAPQPSGTGTLDDPYNALGAVNAVKDLTWTSNTDYEKTDEVYVTGKISRIANNGTYTAGGTYGNASFYISEDGNAINEFYCYRVLYLGNKKFVTGQTDIKVGDEVVIYGQLMNYKGNTPETVSGNAYLYSLNGATEDEPAGTTTATIKFGSNDVKINSASVSGNDDKGNVWTIKTEGTTSFTSSAEYYQVGSSSKPATSITFTTTLPEVVTKVNNLSIKLGGFSGTAGDITLKVGSTTIGSGSLNATNDVIVSSTSSADGRTITITIDNISKGVKVYNIAAEYE